MYYNQLDYKKTPRVETPGELPVKPTKQGFIILRSSCCCSGSGG